MACRNFPRAQAKPSLMPDTFSYTASLEQLGYVIVPAVLRQAEIDALKDELAPLLKDNPAAGIRGLARKASGILKLADSVSLRSLIDPLLGEGAQLVRTILFNKSEYANWQVAWHQDLSIAVAEKSEVEGYDNWSIKEGVPHVQPPVELLENMLTVRLHLDAADNSNGALWVAPGSHRLGRLPDGEAAAMVERHGKHLCSVESGDALLMRPLLLHASRKTSSPKPRRIIHFEFSASALPHPLSWAES